MKIMRSTACAASLGLFLAPLTGQVSAGGSVFFGGARVATVTSVQTAAVGTPVRPLLNLEATSDAFGVPTHARLRAEVVSNGFDVSADSASYVFAVSSVKANFGFGITASTETSGRLLVEIRGTDRPVLEIMSSSIGSRSFSGTETRYSIPMTVGPGLFQDIRMFASFDHPPLGGATYLYRSSSIRVRFEPTPSFPRCDITPYGRSCARLEGTHDRLLRRIQLRLTSDLPNSYGRVLIGRRPQNVPLSVPGCFQLIEPNSWMPTIVFRTDRLGNSVHSIPAPAEGTTIYVQDVIGDGRAGGRSTNGLKVTCR